MKIETGQILLFIGDSITDAGRTGQFPPFGQGWMAMLRSMVMARCPGLVLKFVNKGVSGHTVLDLERRWETDVLQEKPDHLFVMIGINDVWRNFAAGEQRAFHVPLDHFRETYAWLVRQSQEAGIGSIHLLSCFFVEPNRDEPMRAMCDRYNAAVAQLAEENGCAFIDTQEAIDRLLTHQHPMVIAADRVHPNPHGHQAVAEAVYAAVWEG
jgi:lysophospholipase L1-like esterase